MTKKIYKKKSILYSVCRYGFYFAFYGNAFHTGRLTNHWSRTCVEYRGPAEKSLSPQLLKEEACPAHKISLNRSIYAGTNTITYNDEYGQLKKSVQI